MLTRALPSARARASSTVPVVPKTRPDIVITRYALAYGIRFSELPTTTSQKLTKPAMATVNTTEMMRAKQRLLPSASSALSRSPRPINLEISDAPPMPTMLPAPIVSIWIGIIMEKAARPWGPTKRPINMVSTV